MRLVLACLVMGFGGGCSALASMDSYSFDGHSDPDSGGDSNGSDSTTEGSDSTEGSNGSTEDTSTESGDDTETQTSPPSCPAHTHACVEDAVEGWNGPVALYVDDVGTTPPACGGTFPTTSIDALTDFEIPNSSCGCSCGPSTGATCAGTAILWYHGSSMTCGSAGSSFYNFTQACIPMGTVFGNAYWRLDVSGLSVSSGSCEPKAVVDVPPVEWGSSLLGCGGAQDAGGCSAGSSCLQRPIAPFAASLCVYRQGDVQCPAASAYRERAVYATGVHD
ncbi:MAG: hypothetical protein MUC50_08840, partial [Myxococcota bacterium]|nr:hypothetical protein [Myxococcota bacterium]